MTLGPVERASVSWYGSAHHGGIMANGQRYDMGDPTTCASNDYALGARLVVAFEGRAVVCQVRDRMAPGWHGAVDMSRAGFARLAPLSRGRLNAVVSEVTPCQR